MSRTSKAIVMVAGLTAALLFGVAAFAQPGPGGHPGPGIGKIMDVLGLTDQQRQKVQPMIEEHRAAAQDLHQKMRSDHQALKAALEAATPDATAVGKAALALKADRDAAKAQRDALHAKVAKVLTPEQNAKLDGFLAGMRAGRGRGMARMGGAAGPPM